MSEPKYMNLSDLRKHNLRAFNQYVDMLVEDCQDSFAVGEDGVLHAYTPDPRDFDDACPEITCHQVWNVHALTGPGRWSTLPKKTSVTGEPRHRSC